MILVDEVTPVATQDNTEVVPEVTPEVTPEAKTPEPVKEPEPVDSAAAPEPVDYNDLTVPENFSAPMDEFKSWAKDNNLSKDTAQSAVDFYTQVVVPQQETAYKEQIAEWTNESMTKHGKKGIETANKALSRFSTPEFVKFLDETGMGNHPDMIGIFKNIGNKISESGWIDGSSKPANGPNYYPGLPGKK